MAYIATTTSLSANATWTSPTYLTDRADSISGTVFSDQPGTIYIEQSGNGQNWDLSTSYPVVANDGKGFSEALYAPYVRLRYVNGATNQGTFRVFSRFTSAGEGT